MATETFTVQGMTCDHCVNSVRGELAKLDGVTTVEVELSSGRVTVNSDRTLDAESVRAAIDEAGYEVAP